VHGANDAVGLVAMTAIRSAALLSLLTLATACASRTSPAPSTAAPPRAAQVTRVAAPSNPAPSRESVLAGVTPSKRKLLEGALISTTNGGCWDAARHAMVMAETVADDGTPYFAPHELSIDLDGDGVPDPVVEVDRDGDSVRYELYLKRGSCSHHLGTVRLGGTILGPLGKANGLRTLEVVGLCEPPCKDVEHTEIVFDGKGWRPAKQWTTPTM